jgi:hypothetical protein
MYTIFLTIHSIFRWLVLISLLFAIFRAYSGLFSKRAFTKSDESVRKWTLIIIHIQLLEGIVLYFVSPLIKYFLQHFKDAVHQGEIRFYGMEHTLMMLIAVVILTIGSAKVKRKKTDANKFKTMAIWFTIGLLIILIAIPWPFSPLSERPYFRMF